MLHHQYKYHSEGGHHTLSRAIEKQLHEPIGLPLFQKPAMVKKQKCSP
jgi:hypothetical protein